jgi:hypothetical protein
MDFVPRSFVRRSKRSFASNEKVGKDGRVQRTELSLRIEMRAGFVKEQKPHTVISGQRAHECPCTKRKFISRYDARSIKPNPHCQTLHLTTTKPCLHGFSSARHHNTHATPLVDVLSKKLLRSRRNICVYVLCSERTLQNCLVCPWLLVYGFLDATEASGLMNSIIVVHMLWVSESDVVSELNWV